MQVFVCNASLLPFTPGKLVTVSVVTIVMTKNPLVYKYMEEIQVSVSTNENLSHQQNRREPRDWGNILVPDLVVNADTYLSVFHSQRAPVLLLAQFFFRRMWIWNTANKQ